MRVVQCKASTVYEKSPQKIIKDKLTRGWFCHKRYTSNTDIENQADYVKLQILNLGKREWYIVLRWILQYAINGDKHAKAARRNSPELHLHAYKFCKSRRNVIVIIPRMIKMSNRKNTRF